MSNVITMKIPVKKITVIRAEGPCNLCGKKVEFNNFQDSYYYFLHNNSTYPKQNEGYDKHEFWVVWDDGAEYKGRLDVKQVTCNDNDMDIAKHIKNYAIWMTGQAKKPYCGMNKYIEYINTIDIETKEYFKDLLLRYDLECFSNERIEKAVQELEEKHKKEQEENGKCKSFEYKGHPCLKLPNGFSFGLSKAKEIINNIEEIKKFVANS